MTDVIDNLLTRLIRKLRRFPFLSTDDVNAHKDPPTTRAIIRCRRRWQRMTAYDGVYEGIWRRLTAFVTAYDGVCDGVWRRWQRGQCMTALAAYDCMTTFDGSGCGGGTSINNPVNRTTSGTSVRWTAVTFRTSWQWTISQNIHHNNCDGWGDGKRHHVLNATTGEWKMSHSTLMLNFLTISTGGCEVICFKQFCSNNL